jgi:tetratricopeptide (TPR) repeat protein
MELIQYAKGFDSSVESRFTTTIELRSSEMELDDTIRPARASVLQHAPKGPSRSLMLRPTTVGSQEDESEAVRKLGESLANQAVVLAELGRPEEAFRYFAEARRLLEEVGNQPALSSCLRNEALARRMTGDLVGALELFRAESAILRQNQGK